MNLALSERFGKHEAVILWHISNELGGNGGDGACHCELCQEAFRGWLKNKYKTLDNINHAWWNRFWSHVYTDWDQIHSPVPHGENVVHGLNLDWKRFVTAQMADFCEKEAEALRTCSPLPVTTNFMDFFKSLDYHQLHKCLDVVSWDNYPDWHADYDEVSVAVRAAAGHSMMRSMKKQPFLLMESTPSMALILSSISSGAREGAVLRNFTGLCWITKTEAAPEPFRKFLTQENGFRTLPGI